MWRAVDHGLRQGATLELVDVAGEDGRLILIGDDQGNIYRSVDGGGTWEESRLSADEPSTMPIPLPELGEVVVEGVDMFDELPEIAPPFRGVPTGMADEDSGEGREEGEGGLAPRNRSEDPGDVIRQVLAGWVRHPTGVNWLATCETDAARVYAATDDGLYRSSDAGRTWLRVFGGANVEETSVLSVVCDERDADRVYIGTGVGFFSSTDGGIAWRRPTGPWGALPTCYIAPDPTNPDRIYIGTYGGVYVTTDLDDFTDVYISMQGSTDARINCSVEPTDAGILYVGSNDGGVVSRDGGRTFEPMAPELLERHVIGMLWYDPRDARHLYILTDDVFWETRDAGRTVEPLYTRRTNALLGTFALDPNDPDRVWLVTGDQLLVLEPETVPFRPVRDDAVARAAESALATTPPLDAVLDGVLERTELDLGTLVARRAKARHRHALPQIAAAAWVSHGSLVRTWSGLGTVESIDDVYSTASCRLSINPPNCWLAAETRELGVRDQAARTSWGVGVTLSWNLPFLEFDRAESNTVWNDVMRIRGAVEWTVAQAWAERARALRELAQVAHDPRTMIALSIRVEEMTALLDALTLNQEEP
ncbi:MAG: hypothetical protein HYY06_25240 [Deltaproteobacteria bacterium]|nr:hypothetical protein [Deltaproteobacteria bacterium]